MAGGQLAAKGTSVTVISAYKEEPRDWKTTLTGRLSETPQCCRENTAERTTPLGTISPRARGLQRSAWELALAALTSLASGVPLALRSLGLHDGAGRGAAPEGGGHRGEKSYDLAQRTCCVRTHSASGHCAITLTCSHKTPIQQLLTECSCVPDCVRQRVTTVSPAGVAQGSECRPEDGKVSGSIPVGAQTWLPA